MGLVIDVIIVTVMLVIIWISAKKGAFATLMSLISGVASLVISYAFTPMLSQVLKEKLFLRKMSENIVNTIASLCENGTDASKNVIYDVSKLIGNSQFASMIEKYKADGAKTTEIISKINDNSHAAVEKVSNSVADGISTSISNFAAFVMIFVASMIVLTVITVIISNVFKLPVLKEINTATGIVIGIITSVFFLLVFAMFVNYSKGFLTSVSSSAFPENFADDSIILKTLAKYNVIEKITHLLGI